MKHIVKSEDESLAYPFCVNLPGGVLVIGRGLGGYVKLDRLFLTDRDDLCPLCVLSIIQNLSSRAAKFGAE